MRGEIEGALYSLQLYITERDLLELEVSILLNRLDAEVSVAVKRAPIGPERDSSGSLKKSRKPPERSPELEALRKLIREMNRDKLSATEMCARLANHPRPPGVEWQGKTWSECLRNNRGAVQTWISKALLREVRGHSRVQ